MGYIIATTNMKGGVGKTTLTVNLATCLAKNHGKRVLVVDLDTQISATLSMMSPADFAKLRRDRRTLKQLVHATIKSDGRRLNDIIIDTVYGFVCNIKGLDLWPGDIELYDEFIVSEVLHEQALYNSDRSFQEVWNRFEKILIKTMLQPVRSSYDFILLDCAPGYNLLTRSSLMASDFYLLPAKPEPLSLLGVQLLERRISQLRDTHEYETPVKLDLLGIVFTMSTSLLGGRYYKQVMQRVREDYSENKIFNTHIPTDINVSKAVDRFMPVVLTDPKSSGAQAFSTLTQEFLQKIEQATDRERKKTKFRFA